ncbi:MAG: shikimate kinase [Aigarchaeota archaeon]|nr:shikimate kinase [Candidatus Pelearchaeum maunauluense]
MKGYAKAFGAVSIVNAIAAGRGSALGIDLYTEASVEITNKTQDIILKSENNIGDSSLTREVFRIIAERIGLADVGALIRTSSNIPVAVGLKSSSSSAVAIACAVLDAARARMQDEELLSLIAEASLRSGTSITGAMDDAAACMLGGLVITDNIGRKLLKRVEIHDRLYAVIHIPEQQRIFTRDFRKELLYPVKRLVEEAFRLALEDRYWDAMTLNGLLHAAALSIPVAPALAALRAGALGAGLSGTGPATAAICTTDKLDAVREAMEEYGGMVIVAQVSNKRAIIGGGF